MTTNAATPASTGPGAGHARSLRGAHGLALAVAMTAWTGALFAIVRTHHLEFRTQKFDLGNMTQAVWSTAQGRPLEITNASGEQLSRMSGHVDPILALLAPAWIVVPSPLTLVFVQIAACALGAVPVYWLGVKYLGSRGLGLVVALVYLTYPWLAWIALDAMHPVTLAIPLFLYAFWFLDSDRLVPFALVAALACLTGELMGVTLAALGLWYALARHERRAGLTIVAAGLGWSIFSLYVIVPHHSGGESFFYGAYDTIGGSPQGVIRTLATDPGAVVSELATAENVAYAFALVAPLGGVLLLSPLLAAVALPQFLANTLTSLTTPSSAYWHYTSAIVPFIVAATVLGLARIPPRAQAPAAAGVLGISILLAAVLGPWPQLWSTSRLVPHQSWWQGAPPPGHIDALRAALALIPGEAPVSSTGKVGAHLSSRRYVYSVPVIGRAEWVVVDARDPAIPPGAGAPKSRKFRSGTVDPARIARFLETLDASKNWTRVFHRSDVSVYRRTSDEGTRP